MSVRSRLSRDVFAAVLVTTGAVALQGCVIPESDVTDSVSIDTVGIDTAGIDASVRADTAVSTDTFRRNSLTAALPAGSPVTDAEIAYLHSRRLLIPVPGVRASELPDMFDEARSGGRRHDAIDIAAPRGTAVLSVDHGRIARIDTSDRGGLSLYAEDPSGRFVYYYAHLDRYRAGLRNGMAVARGDTIGFVGTSGNAPPDTPHLHFAISRLDDPRRWWDGTPIDPRPLFVGTP